MIRVLLVEDHPIVREGLARILDTAPDLRLVAAVGRIEDMPDRDAPPDVVLFDLHLPSPLQGLVGVRHLADLGLRVLVLTGDDTGMAEVADALAAGALGYLTKHAATGEYEVAIRAIAAGRGYIGERLAAFARRASESMGRSDPNRLTGREAEVAGLIVDGYTNCEIAHALHVSQRTVDGHVENIKHKLRESRRVRVALRLRELGYRRPSA